VVLSGAVRWSRVTVRLASAVSRTDAVDAASATSDDDEGADGDDVDDDEKNAAALAA
jgi:hypothetical protein